MRNRTEYNHLHYLNNKKYYKEKHHQWYLNNKEKKLKQNKEWKEKNKEKWEKYNINWKKHNPEKISKQNKRYSLKYPEKIKQNLEQWIKNNPEKYMLIQIKHNNKRKRELGFNLLYENIIKEKFDYHHINNIDVIALPRDIHRLYHGNNLLEHKFMCNEIIKQIYRRN